MRTGKRDRNAEWRKDDNRSDVRVRNEQTNQQRVKALETGQCHGDRWSRCGRSVSVGRTVGVQVRRKYKVTSRCKRIRLQNKTGNQQGRSTMIVTWNNQNHKVRILCLKSYMTNWSLLDIDNCFFALTFDSGVNTDYGCGNGCRKLKPSTSKLFPYNPHVLFAIQFATRLDFSHKYDGCIMTQRKCTCHCTSKTSRDITFPGCYPRGNGGTAGITAETLHCKGKRTLLMEEAKKVIRESDKKLVK